MIDPPILFYHLDIDNNNQTQGFLNDTNHVHIARICQIEGPNNTPPCNFPSAKENSQGSTPHDYHSKPYQVEGLYNQFGHWRNIAVMHIPHNVFHSSYNERMYMHLAF
jgi:hypothetical protein